MFTPSIYTKDFANDFTDLMRGFGDFFAPSRFGFDSSIKGITTDVQEFDDHYQFDLELPGYKKEDVQASLKDGYMTITAQHEEKKEEKDEEGKYIRRERYSGHCSRSFYVGDIVTEEDIQAKFADGILKVEIPKKEYKPEIEEKKYISIG